MNASQILVRTMVNVLHKWTIIIANAKKNSRAGNANTVIIIDNVIIIISIISNKRTES